MLFHAFYLKNYVLFFNLFLLNTFILYNKWFLKCTSCYDYGYEYDFLWFQFKLYKLNVVLNKFDEERSLLLNNLFISATYVLVKIWYKEYQVYQQIFNG